MHYNDQAKMTDEAIPVAPVDPTNNSSNVVPGDYPNDVVADPSSVSTTTEENTPTQAKDNPTPDVTEEPETPDWFMKDKFKSIDDQAKSYKDLASKMGKYWGTPDEGYKVQEGLGFEDNDPLIAGISPALKEMGVSQDGFNHLVGQYLEANKFMMKEMEESLKKTLTETDAHTYNEITKWMDDSLTPEESTQIKNNWLMTAEDFKLFNNIRLMLAPSTNVPNGNTNAVKYESSNEVTNDKIKYKKELKAGTRVQDKNYEDQLAARFRDAAARELRNKGR